MKNIQFCLTVALLNTASLIPSFSMENIEGDKKLYASNQKESATTTEAAIGPTQKIQEELEKEMEKERALIERAYKGLVSANTIGITQSYDFSSFTSL